MSKVAYGIRHENLVVCKKAEQNEYGQFMCFENLTMVPFDLDAIDPEQMTVRRSVSCSIRITDRCMRQIAPYLNEEEEQLAERKRQEKSEFQSNKVKSAYLNRERFTVCLFSLVEKTCRFLL